MRGEKMSDRERLVIIGGSAASPSAAARAKRVSPDLERYKDDEAVFERRVNLGRLEW
jgi:hypothetical protein